MSGTPDFICHTMQMFKASIPIYSSILFSRSIKLFHFCIWKQITFYDNTSTLTYFTLHTVIHSTLTYFTLHPLHNVIHSTVKYFTLHTVIHSTVIYFTLHTVIHSIGRTRLPHGRPSKKRRFYSLHSICQNGPDGIFCFFRLYLRRRGMTDNS